MSSQTPDYEALLAGSNLEADVKPSRDHSLETPMLSHRVRSLSGQKSADWSAFTGIWVDRGGSFYGGVKIEITNDAWRPLNPPQRVHQTATFKHRIINDTALELVEIRVTGAKRIFHASPGIGNTLKVQIEGVDAPLKWTLRRDGPATIDVGEQREESTYQKTGILIGLVVLLIVLGISTTCLLSGYDVMTGTYLVAQVITTVGFGDVPLQTAPMKIFMVLYILLCVPVSAYAMNLGVQYVMVKSAKNYHSLLGANGPQRQSAAKRVSRERHQHAIRRVVVSFSAFLGMAAIGTAYFSIMEACTCSYDQFLLDDCVDDTYQSCVDSGGYTKSVLDSFYMCVTMLTTVGFGDVSPRSFWGRVFCSIYSVIGCLTTARCISELTRFFFEKDAERVMEYDARITPQIFEAMDLDSKGHITRSDFINHMLLTHNLVKQSELDAINIQFDKIDIDRSDEVSYGNMASARAKSLWKKLSVCRATISARQSSQP